MSLQDYDENPISYDNTLLHFSDDPSDPAPSDPKYTLLHFTDIYGNELIMTVAEWENTPNYRGEDSSKMTAISDDGDQYELLIKSV